MSSIRIRAYRAPSYAIVWWTPMSHRRRVVAYRSTYAQALGHAHALRRATGRPYRVRRRTQIYQTLALALPFTHPWR